jgi:hypothetical protein
MIRFVRLSIRYGRESLPLRHIYLESIAYAMQAGNVVEYPRKFAGFPIIVELENALRLEPFVSFCRRFSDGNFGSSLFVSGGTGEF